MNNTATITLDLTPCPTCNGEQRLPHLCAGTGAVNLAQCPACRGKGRLVVLPYNWATTHERTQV